MKTWNQEQNTMSNADVVRTNLGRWAPGTSGNRSGRPKVDISVVSLARQHTPAAIATLAGLMVDPEQPGGVRVQSACALIDRAWGRVHQSLAVGLGVVGGERGEELQHIIEQLKGVTISREMLCIDAEAENNDDDE